MERCSRHRLHHLPLLLSLLLGIATLLHGPIAQLENYHAFADQLTLLGIPHCADVLSNLGFAGVALWGLWRLTPARRTAELAAGWPGYALFLVGLLLTAAGSSWYHLAPDDHRLLWDRLPIALASAGLLAGVWGDCRQRRSAGFAAGLGLAAIFGVLWWYGGALQGGGDLRPYLLLQVLTMLLIPLWQWLYRRPRGERLAFGAALGLYALAKVAELLDHPLAALLPLSGHSLKHLLSVAATAVVVAWLVRRRTAALAADTAPMAPSPTGTHFH
ncbi:hypothetical protein KRX52_09880 [Pseudomonas sp. MAP12]|uniref:Alkaline phytoceramidase n=1 Tax=Geopseudomonas aromaticivorans TaxID=2849492 RepID=A0ABS6MX36_9GAMM|nr:hypothetical protein [Pseudomonas aromaticivorans]MBV2133110.1 hypothetical protein [Pseudomonas aromaticivorans]